MTNYDIPNDEELQPGVVYNYDLIWKQYPISDNHTVSTYNQFIQLRDTLVFTKKKYPGKAWKRLIVWDKWDGTDTGTIEVRENNYFRQWIQPDRQTNPLLPDLLPEPSWRYITAVPADIKAQDSRFGELSCMIQKDWHYRIMHKEEILLSTNTDKVFCYVDVYRKNGQWNYEIPQDMRWWVAVYDWEWRWWDYKLGELFKKMTASSVMEKDLLKWDILVLRFQDGTYDSSTGEPTGNPLTLQQDSNYWSIEYLDLPYKK
jgi:hypothetical protein